MFQSDTYGMCFACGKDNPIGLRLQFEPVAQGRVACEFTAGENHQGWTGILHGGLVSTLLDEAMAHAVLNLGHKAVTAKMEVRWRCPAPVGQALRIEGEVTGVKGKVVEAKSALYMPDGRVAAQAKGLFMTYGG